MKDLSDFYARVQKMADLTGGGVVGMLMWYGPLGEMWIAPLGTPAPDPDRPMPAAWMRVQRVRDPE